MEYPFYEQQLRQQYRLLGHEGHYTQVHLQAVNEIQWGPRVQDFVQKHGRQPTSDEFNKLKVLDRRLLNGEEAVVAWARQHNGKGNCFLGLNPRTKDGTVHESTCLSLDLDPIRPKDTAATEEQWETTIEACREIKRRLGHGIISSSGNGGLILFPLRERMSKEDGEACGKALVHFSRQILKERQLDEKVEIDSTFDAPRLGKVLGTVSTKGREDLWRTARFLDSPTPDFRHYDTFISQIRQTAPTTAGRFQPPHVEKGSLDRSKADISLANRLKLQGFTPSETFTALCTDSFRPGREDDYKRIIEKIYFAPDANHVNGASVVDGGNGGKEARPIQLWTPENGLLEYRNRVHTGVPELPTGFNSIDRATFGLVRGSIFTVAGRTNCGKTTFAVSVASNLCRASRRTAFISTETGFAEIWDRFAAVGTGISGFSIQHGTYPAHAKERIENFFGEFRSWPLFIYDGSRPNIQVIKQVIDQSNPDVLVFDYFQHVESRETRDLENLVMAIKDLAKEKNVAILLCAMLHDGPINPKTNKLYPPTLGNMKNCKVINDESRVVLLLDWDRDNPGDGAAAVKVVMAKNKGSKTDVVLKLDRSIPRFEEGD